MSLIDRLALGALDADEAALQDEKMDPVWQQAAVEAVRGSQLAAWFPPLGWVVVDHNLPQARPAGDPEFVVVTPDDDEHPIIPLRFILTKQPGMGEAVWIAGPDGRPGAWAEGATLITRAGDVGRWIRENRGAS